MRKVLTEATHLLIGGHRGCSCEFPENSIAAMQEGIRRGADYLEIDIQLTADSVPVVYHDIRLECQTALTGYVHEHSYAELQANWPGLCTLREALVWGHKVDAHFGLELKTLPWDMQPYNLKLVECIAQLLEDTLMSANVFVFGQDYQVLSAFHRCAENVMLGLIVPFIPKDPAKLMQEMNADIYLSYIYNMTPHIVETLKGNGYFVSASILSEAHWIEEARRIGVNMFDSNNPEQFQNR